MSLEIPADGSERPIDGQTTVAYDHKNDRVIIGFENAWIAVPAGPVIDLIVRARDARDAVRARLN